MSPLAAKFLEPQYFIPAWLVLWLLGTGLIARLGGWATLATKYRSDQPASGESYKFVSGWMGWRFLPVSYGNCLFVHVGATGLRLSILFPFRFQSPPLFLPWSEVESVTEKRILFVFPYVVLNVRNEWPRITLYGRVVKAILRGYAAHTQGRANKT